MATAAETWYVRLPDGRTWRARSADVLRGHVRSGRIPAESQVRRSGAAEWLPLHGVAEFAPALGLVAPPVNGVVPSEPRPFGVRAVVAELLNAFDSTLQRAKLVIAALTGFALVLGLFAFEYVGELPSGPAMIVGYLAASLFVLTAVALATVLLTQLTVIELDRHRPARAVEVYAQLFRHVMRVAVGQGVVAGLLIGLLLGIRAAVPWLASAEPGDVNVLAAVLAVVRVLLEVVCWPLLGLAVVQLGPLLVIDEQPMLASMRDWLGLVRRNLARIYLYEALTLTFALVLVLPVLLLAGVATYAIGDAIGPVERTTLLVLAGLALAPLFAYLLVANVFIYLNLRYEFFFSARER